MKKILRNGLIVVVAMFLTSIPLSAHDFEVDGIYYNITDSTALSVEVTYSGSSYNEIADEYSGSIIIPETVTHNGISYSVTLIGSSAFYNCTELTSITVPCAVTGFEMNAFYGCTALTEVNITDLAIWCNTYFHNGPANPLYYAKRLKLNGDAITNLQIPSTVTEINGCVFIHCVEFVSVSIPNSVTSIGSSAFSGCTGLTEITIPNSVTSIDNYAFSGCTGLTSITSNCNTPPTIGSSSFPNYNATLHIPFGTLDAYQSAEYWSNFTNIIGENSIDGLKYSKISDTEVKVIGMTESVNNIAIPSTITINNDTYTITEIADSAFMNCRDLASITIPNTVIKIGLRAFYRCTGLTSVAIPNLVTSIGNYAFYYCTGLTSVIIGNSVTSIGNYAFCYCTSLTSVIIGNSVTSIGSKAFFRCTGLTAVTIPNSVTTIGDHAFDVCTGLTSVTIPNSMTRIGDYVFNRCTSLTSVTIPNSVTSIGYGAFYNCTSLTSVTIPNSVTSIAQSAFVGCDKLVDGTVVATTQTTATIRLTSPTQYNLGVYRSDSDKKQAENGVVTITGLKPGSTNNNYDLALVINGIYCQIKDFSFTTKSFNAYLSGNTTTTSVSATGTYSNGDMTIIGEGINYGSSVTNYDGNNTITINNLDPSTSYTIYYAVKIQEGGGSVFTTSKSFTTSALTWSNDGFTATSTTSARLSVETSCDATAGTGFEWKRYDAPESLAPSKAPCPVVDGMLIGSLRNLNPDVYYKCRPYYTSSSGNTYYGEWITFFTGDANVYFEPEVRTFDERSVVNNSATVKGYALAGTDDISEQGFEYWKIGSITPSSTDTRMTVKASGISMTATLADLDYNSTYRYRAYVKTAQGTFYGAEMEFSTGEDPSGIEYIEVDDNDSFDVMLRENPATATAWVKVAGASATEAEYYILTTNGGVVANGFIPTDGEYQPIELNIANGLYLMTVTDGTNIKTLRLIVR